MPSEETTTSNAAPYPDALPVALVTEYDPFGLKLSATPTFGVNALISPVVEAMDTVPIPNSTLPKVLIPKVTSSPPLDTLFNSKIVEKPTLELCALKYN